MKVRIAPLLVLLACCSEPPPPAPPPFAPSPSTIAARNAAERARERWITLDLEQDEEASKAAAEGTEQYERALVALAAEKDGVALAAFREANQKFSAAAAKRKQLSEQRHERYVTLSGRAGALRKGLDAERARILSKLAQAGEGSEREQWSLLAQFADAEIFSGDLRTVDARLSEATALAGAKRYARAAEKLEGACEGLKSLESKLKAKVEIIHLDAAEADAAAACNQAKLKLNEWLAGDDELLAEAQSKFTQAKAARSRGDTVLAVAQFGEATKKAHAAIANASKRVAAKANAEEARLLALDAKQRWVEHLKATQLEATASGAAAVAQLERGQQLQSKRAYEQATAAYQSAAVAFVRAVREAEEQIEQRDRAFLENLRKQHRLGAPRDPPGKFITGGKTAQAVRDALEWLADHQDDDGRWDSDGFMKHDPPESRTDGPGFPQHDVGVTALALQAFLEAGYGYTEEGFSLYYGLNIWNGVKFLASQQRGTGAIGDPALKNALYHHAMATRALCSAYRITQHDSLRPRAERAVRYLLQAQNAGLGWGYHPADRNNDTSHTFWAVLALHAAREAGIEVKEGAIKGALTWIEKMTDPDFGVVGYQTPGGTASRLEGLVDRFPPEKTQSTTAAAIWIRMIAGEDPTTSKMIKMGIDLCQEHPPQWDDDGNIDMFFWYAASGALCPLAHERRSKLRGRVLSWAMAVSDALYTNACTSGAARGSWDPFGAWGSVGGRVYSTAMGALALLETRLPPKKKKTKR